MISGFHKKACRNWNGFSNFGTLSKRSAAWLLLGGLFFHGAWLSAADFDALCQEGLSARQAGQYEKSITKFREALVLKPDDVETLRQLATTMGWAKRYLRALQVYEKAMALAPRDMDLRVGAALVKSWQGNLDAARKDLERVVAEQPGHLEARITLARVLVWEKKPAEAETEYRKVLAAAPPGSDLRVEALTGLGDLMVNQEHFRAARDFYQQAQTLRPQSGQILEKLKQAKEPHQWKVDTGYSYSTFTRQSRSDWQEGYVQLTCRVNKKFQVQLRSDSCDRFDLLDESVAGGLDYRFTDWFSGRAMGGGSPNSNFLPRWKAGTGLTARLRKGGEIIGPTLLDFDYRHSGYERGATELYVTGLQQYLTDYFWLSGRWYRPVNLRNQTSDGWLARADWQAHPRVRLSFGLAYTKESLDPTEYDLGRKVDTHTYFGGLQWDITSDLGLRVDYTQEQLRALYTRRAVHLGMFVWF